MEWISVKDKLPKISERVVIYDEAYNNVFISYIMDPETQDREDCGFRCYHCVMWSEYYHQDRDFLHVTYWYPLPDKLPDDKFPGRTKEDE